MTEGMMGAQALLGKSCDSDLPREMIGLAVERPMELVVGPDWGGLRREECRAAGPAQPLSQARLGEGGRHRRSAHPRSYGEELLSGFPPRTSRSESDATEARVRITSAPLCVHQAALRRRNGHAISNLISKLSR